MQTFEKIKKIRLSLTLSQTALAKESKMSQCALSIIEEGGTSNINTSLITFLINKYNVNPYYIFFDDPIMFVDHIPKKANIKIIYNIRIALGFSQKNFAEELGTNQHQISCLENGKRLKINFSIIENLITRFNINPYYIFSGDPEMFIKHGIVYNRKKLVEELKLTQKNLTNKYTKLL